MIKQKSGWTEAEDAAITLLYEQRHIQDWNEISRLLNQEYNFLLKKPKDCKDRYFNNINPSTIKIQWTLNDQKQFMRLHNQIGNKWATIAQHLPGKSDNCVKNHFYSKLRKLLRKINKIIQFYFKKQFRPIDISIMYKIVQAAEQRFKDKPNCESWVSEQCHGVENKMLEFAMFKDFNNDNQKQEEIKFNEQNLEEYKQLIKQIYRVSKLYKRKSKKVRNSLIQAPVNSSKKKNKKQSVKEDDKSQEQQDNESEEQLYKPKQRVPTTILVRKLHHSQDKLEGSSNLNQKSVTIKENPNNKKHPSNLHTRIQVQEGQGIQQLLRTAGILHDQVKPSNKTDTKVRKSSILSTYSGINMPSPLMNPTNQTNNFMQNTMGIEYSPLNSFSSQQMENFLGFPMVNNTTNSYANFTLSEKSSFKSYSERDPSQIDNPFFDQYSSNNGRMMFPMNFGVQPNHQYQNPFNDHGYGAYQYGNMYYHGQSGQEQEGQSYIPEPKPN